MSTELDSILSEIRGDAPANPYLAKIPKKTLAPTKINTGQVQDVKYDVHRDAIYDRLHDGTYIPRYENYAGQEGNENRLANQQGGLEQLYTGVTKAVGKTFNYALDATVGTVYGIVNAIGEGSMEGLYDNDFSNTLDDWNKRLDYALPNYYSDEQKSMGVLRSMATVNFWANDVAGGLAFVGGALLPELAIAAVTGGASAPASFAKLGLKAGTKSFLKAGSKKIIKEGVESGVKTAFKQGIDDVGINLLRGQRFAKIGEYTGEVLKTAGFVVRTSNFEAGMEARHNLHQSTSEYLSSFAELNGRQPSFEEYSKFLNEAVTASNWVYGSNMAILSLSNMAMFGSKFGVGINTGKKINNFGNKFIGLGVKKTAGKEAALAGANKLQRLTGNAYLILGKASVEGIYEEGLQGVAGTTMQNYLKAKYDPDHEDGYNLWSSLTDAFATQYTTKEGWKEMAVGMIIGMGAPALQGQAPNGFGKNSRKSREKKIQSGIDIANKGQVILKNIDRANTMSNFRNKMESDFLNDEDTELSNTIINTDFIKSQEHLKTAGEIVEDFNAIIDNTEFSKEQAEDLGGVENALSYKESLKNNFSNDVKNYRSAKQLVESIGLGDKLKNTPGNLQEVGEALTMSFMVGKSSLSKAKLIAEQIDALTGSDGVFNSLEHYNNLSQDKKAKIVEVKDKRKKLEELRKTATSLGSQLAGVKLTNNTASVGATTAQNSYNKFSEKLVITQNFITKLEEELTTLTEAIDLDFRAENTNLDGSLSVDPSFQTVEVMLGEIDKLDNYVKSLDKSGKKVDAAALSHLLNEFKIYSDAHRQMNSDFRRMFDTNFFSAKEGGSLTNTILGRKYVMSEDFRKLIRENDKAIDASMRKAGLKGYENVEAAINSTITENEELSDREKYRRESIIRMLLGAERLRNRLDEAQADYEEIIESAEERNQNLPLKGDTIILKKSINPQGKDLSNLDLINNMINDIVEEIDSIRDVKGKQEQVKNLQLELDEVRKETVEEEVEKGDHKKVLKIKNLSEEFLTDAQRELLGTYGKFLDREEKIEALEQQIKDARKGANFKIASTEEYKKLRELTEKRQAGTITPEEIIELQEVSDDIDQWLLITGTVVEGLRLSDLIRQKVVLENTPVTKVEQVAVVTSQEVIDQIELPDKTEATNYSYGQTYEGVTAINTKDGIEISGIKPTLFSELTGIANPVVNAQGNVIINIATQEAINNGGVLSILPTNKNLATNYSVVLVTRPGFEPGSVTTQPLTSNFNSDFNNEMDPDALYNLKPGDELTLEVNPDDLYNQQLLAAYREVVGEESAPVVTSEKDLENALEEDTKYQDLTLDLEMLEEQERKATTYAKPAITKKKLKKQEAIYKRIAEVEKKLSRPVTKGKKTSSDTNVEAVREALRKSLVIRVKDTNGNFVAVLKGKRNSDAKSLDAIRFEGLRDQIVEDDAFMLRLVRTGVSEQIPIPGKVVTKRVLIGHPNFNFSRNADGSVSIDSRMITADQLKFVDDIGYVQNGKIFTKSAEKGLDTTFLKRSIANSSAGKMPFVVISRGETRFAYPVKLLPQEKASLDDFKKIFESDLRPVDKVISLNTYMAGRGVDIKQTGNSFTIFNLEEGDSKFFNEKVAQMEGMDYYKELDSWIDPKTDIADDLVGQVSIDVDITSPLHSPKIQMDFSGLDIKTTPISQEVKSTKEKKVKKDTMSTGSGVANFLHKCK